MMDVNKSIDIGYMYFDICWQSKLSNNHQKEALEFSLRSQKQDIHKEEENM